MPKSHILTSQICILILFPKIKFSRKFLNLQFNSIIQVVEMSSISDDLSRDI